MNKNTVITAVVSAAVGGIAGGVITYVTVNKKLVKRYEDWANAEIDSVKARYAALNNEGKMSFLEMAENPSPEILSAVEAGKALIEKMGYSPDEDKPHETARTLSIFEQGVAVDADGNPVEEVDVVVHPRDPEDEDDFDHDPLDPDPYVPEEGKPYKISEEEYFENEPGYELDTLTWYEVDETLTDEKNDRIEEVEDTIGVRHTHMFHNKRGKLKNSIYIRNDDHQSLYEVILVEGSYASIVLNMTDEELGLKPEKPRVKKMKKDVD